MSVVGPRPPVPRDNNLDKDNAKQLASQIDSLIGANPQSERLRANIDMQISETEMRIDFHDGAEPGLFNPGGHDLRPEAKRLIGDIAAIISRQRNRFTIEGHLDARPVEGKSRWDLSLDDLPESEDKP